MITIKGIRVDEPGDMSVGLFPGFWEIKGEMFFESIEELNEFKDKIQLAFEIIADCPTVKTFEEYESEYNHYLMESADQPEPYERTVFGGRS